MDVSLPQCTSMMDTVLNLGINDETVQGLVALTSDERFAYDAYRRFIQMFSKIVLDTDPRDFEHVLDRYKERAGVQTDAEIPAADLKKLVVDFKQIAERQTGEPFPTNVYQQLHKAIEAVFSSWNNRRAIDYRNFNKISHSLGTAVNVQSMVFGNLGNDSGTGAVFTRDPGTGEKKLYGEYLLNAQGEDVVAGIRTPSKISHLQEDLPQVNQQLLDLSQQLEHHYRDVQDFEFTIEHGKIWLLQSRLAKRSAGANLRNAIDLLDEGLISVEEAIFRVKPTDLEQILAPRLPSGMNIQPLARGLNASPGIAHGEAIFNAETADELATAGKKVILIVPDTSPDDIHGVVTSQGVVTSRGGATSHAAVACRSLSKPCVAGANIRINALEKHFTVLSKAVKEGDQLTIDGASGVIYEGIIPLVEVNVQDNPYLIRYMGLLESINTDDYVEEGAGILWLLKDTLKNKSIPSFRANSIPLIPESFELATEYRALMGGRFQSWNEVTRVKTAA